MIIHDFDAFRIAAAPHEANPPLVIDSDAVLGTAVCFQCFQPISRRHSQVVQRSGPVEIFELAPDAYFVTDENGNGNKLEMTPNVHCPHDGASMYLAEVLPEHKSFRLWKCPQCNMNHSNGSNL